VSTSTEILEKAAQLLMEHGWTQGELIENDGRMCAIGAIKMAAGGRVVDFATLSYETDGSGKVETVSTKSIDTSDEVDLVAYKRATNRVGRVLDDAEFWGEGEGPAWCIAEYNDHPTRTVEDVILLLKRAAQED